MVTITIGKAAKKTGMSTDAIRLYERYGLIEGPSRTDNGYRCYSHEHIRQLHFIKQAKVMGFTLKEIAELLAISQSSNHACDEVKSQAMTKLTSIQEKIANLVCLEKALQDLLRCCEGHKIDQQCPILEALSEQDGEVKG